MIRWIAVCATAVSLAIAADVTVSSSAYALFGRSSKQAISRDDNDTGAAITGLTQCSKKPGR